MRDFCDLPMKEQLRLEKKGSKWKQKKPPLKKIQVSKEVLDDILIFLRDNKIEGDQYAVHENPTVTRLYNRLYEEMRKS